MISVEFVRMMTRYNHWQNNSLIAAADGLDDPARRADRGAFFKSIHGTFSHLLWGDRMWMHRFTGSEKPAAGIKDSPLLFNDWQAFRQARKQTDHAILDWAGQLGVSGLAGDLVWFSGAVQREMRVNKAQVIVHFFNHQTHHRGQIHAMLTAAGAKPDDTDLMLLPASPQG